MNKRRGRVVVKLAISIFIFLIASEIALRAALNEARVRHGCSAADYFAALGVHASDLPLPPRELPPKGGVRVVVVGDSTAVGFPYGLYPDLAPPGALSFGAFFAAGMQAATGKPIDLQMIAIQGRSSVGVLSDLDAALAADPDVLLMYIGHNEFAHRIANIGPFGRARHGGLDTYLRGWNDLLRGLRVHARTRAAERLDGMPRMFPSELQQAAKFLALGDPEARPPEDLPLEPEEITFHLDRYESDVRAITAKAKERGVRLFIIEPESNLLAPPLASGKLYDPRAQRAYEAGMAMRAADAAGAKRLLIDARDLDPAPIRVTSALMERLRRGAGDAPRISLASAAPDDRFIDPVHPTPALAAVFAERIALALPPDLPHLAAGDAASLERFRAACRGVVEDHDGMRRAVELGDAAGIMLSAYLHLQYGNRGAAEAELSAVPAEKRDFRMLLLMDLALRWRGDAAGADALLIAAGHRHPDWGPSIEWWRARASR